MIIENETDSGCIGGYFSMKVQNHADLFHRGKDWVIGLIGLDATVRVRGHSTGIRLDT